MKVKGGSREREGRRCVVNAVVLRGLARDLDETLAAALGIDLAEPLRFDTLQSGRSVYSILDLRGCGRNEPC